MENMIYTQDPIYLKLLNQISEETFSEDQLPILKSKYSEMLEAYYEIVVQWMADQLPMMISFFMLKETAQFLCFDMLSLLDGANKMKGEVHSHLEEIIRPYIDLIDTLRSIGIQKDLALPTIVVIGDQSSGKSSVLEALSGIALPRGSGPVNASRAASGQAAQSTQYERKFEFEDPSSVERHVKTAQNELAGKGLGISDELITLEVMSPDVCDLTLIDLPGITRVPVKGQPEDIGDQIKSLIMKYIEKQETINLVVVPCNTDIATTEALKMAQEVDPEGIRTVAILTKPDLIDKGTEMRILKIVHNKVIPLRKGYIMVKINNILSSQQEKAEQRISEHFEMENLIYTQDPIFLKILNEIANDKFSEEELPMFDKRCKYSHMLESYYEIVVQRMADQLPMMITLFILKQTSQLLATDILGLLDGANKMSSSGIFSLFSSSDQRSDDEYSDCCQCESHEMKGEVHSQLEESIRPYIDLIDALRSVGIHKDLALPTIVVIGDQSSGKSSVLEALSGVALPRGSGIVTRCPLELRLKKVPDVNWKGVISYRKKKIEFVDSSLVQKYVETAQNELAGKGVGICDELITLEVMSPDACDLTLIDLPGIARVPVKGQPEDIGDQIKQLIMKFTEKQETINMVVVPCNTDIATTEALKMAQEVDPEGKRTVAILTKPDLIDKGTEKSVLAVVHNKVIPLRKGYIMVKCRGQQQIDNKIPLEEAAEMEEDFFQNHDYFRGLLTENKATVRCLAVKLTQNLVDHIKKSLPQLDEEIKKQLWDVRNELREFEDGPPQDPKGAKQFLIKNKINNIQSSQQAKVEQRISEQFEMENMIYTQDPIYLKFLNEISDETFTEDHLPIFDIKSKYSEMMQAYYEIVVQRMADQLPMMISFFMLKETAQLLSIDMLSLLDGANVSQLLLEDSEVAAFGEMSSSDTFSSLAQRSAYDDKDTDISQNESHKMKGEVHSHLEKSIRPYIDLIDTLRTIGIQKDLELPTIAVIGDQSSGKSSVLEALSGVALPRGSGIVTRCPLELRLKKVPGIKWKAVLTYNNKTGKFVNFAGPIKASQLASVKAAQSTHNEKRIEFSDPSLVEKHVAAAQNELAGRGVGISDELITLEIMSPDVCDLTLIDLPGIARVPVEGQPEDIGKQIKRLIMTYIKRLETINLVVVPCNSDIATTEALKMAQEVDPDGIRTVAILTKPDLIDKGTEKNILAIVYNKVIPLRKGYIMVKCRGQQQIDDKISLEEAAQMERDFFQNHDYFRCLLEEDKVTIKSLAIKLTNDLVDHIKKSLPQLHKQVKNQLWSVKSALKNYEDGPPEDHDKAKDFLIKTLNNFNHRIKLLSSGELIRKENEKNMFYQLRAKFKKWNDHLNSTKTPFNSSKELSENFRGRELPGFSNYKKFEKILQDHVAKLKEPATDLLNNIKDIVVMQFTDVVNECFQNYHVLQNITKDKINNIQLTQLEKAEERISEQFKMENIIYTQDPIFLKTLSVITNQTFSEIDLPVFDKQCKYSHMLEAYYEIVVQRMADQLPLMITFYMLQETAQLLSTDIMKLLEKPDVHELLSENSDVSRRRKELRASLNRLTAASEEITKFKA
ncbi:interferon-induced GTP-binding Mx3-like protein [Labeo rohita]|uniref:Interferon-induced GTP-binding Mx3-like protein n=2 Tax=Labeo rohita TaxID=84645 RepID=A0A498MEK9_LABRO|nr:interferon-induced GTP-binding Mx3-like protein [Labeo rohita]